ncbi:hypothetical protein HPB52_022840 [Rhipicephalus sanguineus]|uniref:Peptidase A2 domain-containing protein n=1 Tax=Rhipicephalus sanguineus TaxID=34632 RepID=A0A9D4PSR9_RHISA|nr:hypothetical protein HPB52_022840 [Rhipicephalus sanguineus]
MIVEGGVQFQPLNKEVHKNHGTQGGRRQEEHDVRDTTLLVTFFCCASVLWLPARYKGVGLQFLCSCSGRPSCSSLRLPPAHMAALFANLPPFLDLPYSPPIPWHLWRKIFQVHLKAAGGSGWEDKRRASALISVLGIEGQRKYFAAQEQLEAQRSPNATHTASTPTAADSGTVSTDAATTEVRDQVIHGVANAHVRAKLLSYGEALTLQKAEEVGRDLEALNKANAAFRENERLLDSHSGYGGSIQCVAAAQNGRSAASLVPHVTQHGGGSPPPRRGWPGPRWLRRLDGAGTMLRSLPLGHLATSRNCPAKKKICQFCRIKGHFAAVCRKRRASVQEVTPVRDAGSGTATVLSVQAAPTSPRDLRIPVVVGGQIHMSLLVDTGATASLMMKRDFDALFASKHRLLQTRLTSRYVWDFAAGAGRHPEIGTPDRRRNVDVSSRFTRFLATSCSADQQRTKFFARE